MVTLQNHVENKKGIAKLTKADGPTLVKNGLFRYKGRIFMKRENHPNGFFFHSRSLHQDQQDLYIRHLDTASCNWDNEFSLWKAIQQKKIIMYP